MGKARDLDAIQLINPDTFKLWMTLQVSIDEWDGHLPCQSSPEHFFPTSENGSSASYFDIGMAKEACQTCPIVADCLEYAIAAREDYGIWGGTTPVERKTLRKVLLGERVATTNTEKRYAANLFARFPSLSGDA